MENEIYVIERCLAPGIWELMTPYYYTNEEMAKRAEESITKEMRKYDKKFSCRHTKLELFK